MFLRTPPGIGLLLSSLTLLPPNLVAQEVKVFVLMPPELALVNVKKLAVLDLTGDADYGANVAGYLVEELLKSDRGMHAIKQGLFGMGRAVEGKTLQEGAATNVFEIIERNRLSAVLREQNLTTSGLVDETQAVSVGKILGVDAIVFGAIAVQHLDAPYQDPLRQGTVTCTKRQVKASARFRVVHTETARVMGSTERSSVVEKQACPGDELATVAEVVDEAARSVAAAMADYVAPHFELMEFGLRKLKGKDAEALSDRAGKLAEGLNVDQAYALYKSIHDKDSYNPDVVQNLAVLHEVVGNYEEAREFYGMACELKPENACRRSMERTDRSVAFRKSLAQLGVEPRRHEFQVTETALEQATVQQVEIQGRSEDRVTIFSEPSDQSGVVAAVPGGVTLTVVRQEGQWVRVRLPGGKEGYVSQRLVKVKGK